VATDGPEDQREAELDAALLGALQDGVPLVAEPWLALAQRLDCDVASLLGRLEALRAPGGLIREVSAVFDARALGYRQVLVAFQLEDAQLDACGSVVADHPGVSHCYAREGEYNLWFTLAISPKSRLGMEAGVRAIAHEGKARKQLLLPSQRCYKLDVRWTRARAEAAPPPPDVVEHPAPPLTDEQERAIRALQRDLPAQTGPFASIARAEGLSVDALLDCARDFLDRRWMRRYGAVLHHRRAGAAANVMVAWEVSDDDADDAGTHAAQVARVSHCFLRPAGSDWPYRLYTMVHGRDRDDCLATIDRIALATGLKAPALLWTKKEYKKRRVRLLSDEESDWESRHAPPSPRE
jgi:siroheme decarboxylase